MKERYYWALALTLLAVGAIYVAYLSHRTLRETWLLAGLSVGLTQSDVEHQLGRPDAWITSPEAFAHEPYIRFPASTRAIENAVAVYRRGTSMVYVYYDDQHTVTCVFMSQKTER